jgi:dTDP-glucose 4,6-dehydratase
MNILITGGYGFIGSNFILAAFKKYSGCWLTNIDSLTYAANTKNLPYKPFGPEEKERYTHINADISDPLTIYKACETFPGNKPDVIINFAAESHVDNSIINSDPFIKTNVVGMHKLLDYASKYRVRFIQVSTDEVYGSLDKDGKPFVETDIIKPSSPYAASKASGDLLVQAYHTTYKIDCMITRCCNNYGPRQHKEKFIPKAIDCILNDKIMGIFSKGENIRDWIHVDDHVSAIMKVLENGLPGEIYNIGANSEKTNVEIWDYITNWFQSNSSYVARPPDFIKDRLGHDFRYAINSDKIREKLKWEPKKTFEDGMDETLTWYDREKRESDRQQQSY